ncbi:MAG: gamma-glutamyltransferase family protein [Gaiellaceae bacterium]
MRGAIAAGHPVTAEAGARVLEEGGSAIDACIAAAFASWVAESTLTGPGAGGFLLVHRAHDRSARLMDFFVAVPGLGGGRRADARMELIDVDFGDASSQSFRIGPASCAVPGALAGLALAHRRFGTLPWSELILPAIEVGRAGFEITPAQEHLHLVQDPILRHTEEGRRTYLGEGDKPLVAGARLLMADLADSLELVAREGAAALYGGELGRLVVEHLRERGGEITNEDLLRYRVVWRRPVRAGYRQLEFLSNPPPSSGGILIAYGLELLDRIGEGGVAGSSDAAARLVEVMREQTRARGGSFARELRRGGLARRLLSEEQIAAGLARIEAERPGLVELGRQAGTTHISVMDAEGNAASLTASLGAASGVVVPGTGIHLNNILGEEDLVAGNEKPGARLTSMMAPSLVLDGGTPRLVLGSAGSVRLRGAILQTVVNVVGHGMPVDEAVARPRVHVDEPQVHCEGGEDVDPELANELERRGYAVTRWQRRNLFFGGVSAVERRPDGSLAAAGDPRRGGAGIVVR